MRYASDSDETGTHQAETLDEFVELYGFYTRHVINYKLPEGDKITWVEALRSGNYKQGFNHLVTGDGNYCCLGVKCQIDERVTYIDMDNGYTYQEVLSNSTLPRDYAQELGINTEGEFYISFKAFGKEWFQRHTLMSCNDDAVLSFNQIADIIEYFF